MPEGRPRVLLVAASATGGVARHVADLLAELPDLGFEVRLAAGPGTLQPAVRLELPVRPRPAQLARAVRQVRAAARSTDLVHAHGVRAAAVAAAARTRAPLVSSWHNAPAGPLAAALERLGARRSRVALAASTELVDLARERGARDARLLEVGGPVLPVPSGRRPVDTGERPLVLAVSRLHPQKGMDVLPELARLVPAAVFAVAGDGPLLSRLRAAAPEVRWLGHVADRQLLSDLYQQASVVVLPSRWEARALTAQEALLAGRPLVASNVGGVPGLVRDGAVLVPAGSTAELAAAVRELLEHPATAAALAERGRRVASCWPDAAATASAVAAVYREVLAR